MQSNYHKECSAERRLLISIQLTKTPILGFISLLLEENTFQLTRFSAQYFTIPVPIYSSIRHAAVQPHASDNFPVNYDVTTYPIWRFNK
jgi:hypothetical protein